MPDYVKMLVCAVCTDDLDDKRIYKTAYEMLPDERKAKIDRLAIFEDKKRSVAAGLALYYATECYLNKEDSFIFTRKNASDIVGKCVNEGIDKWNEQHPIILLDNGKPDFSNINVKVNDKSYEKVNEKYDGESIHFSIAHAGNYAICVVADDVVGIDIEGNRRNISSKVSHYFSEWENDWVGEDEDRFYRLWTVKEAYCKMTGEGIAKTIGKVHFILDGKEWKMDCGGCKDIKIYELEIDDYRISIVKKLQ